jgi:hypothetical protein
MRNMPESSASGEDVGQRRERVEGRLAGEAGAAGTIAVARVAHGAERLDRERVGLAHHHGVGEGGERERVRERERAPRQDERVPRGALLAERRDGGRLEQLDHAGELELVRHRERDDRHLAQRAQALVRERRVAEARLVVGEEGPLRAHPVLGLHRLVDLEEAERAHPRAVRRGVREPDAERRALVDPPDLGAEATADDGELGVA